MPKYKEISDRLKEIQSILQYENNVAFAESMSDVSYQNLNMYMKGDRLSVEFLVSLFRHHKISPLYVLTGEGPTFVQLEEVNEKFLRAEVLKLQDDSKRRILKDLVIAVL